MKLLFLGTGTSVGVPVIGCDCPVCVSPDPRNRRLRSSLYVEAGGTALVVDTGPDFREQMLRHHIRRLDAVCFTHSHADHVFGFDDIRRFNTIQDAIIPAYAVPGTMDDLMRIFDYVHRGDPVPGVYRPRIDFRVIREPFQVGAIRVTACPVDHGPKPTVGYRFEAGGRRVGYFPDCLRMDAATVRQLQGLDIMILDALRHRPHSTHLTVADSVALLQSIGARQSYLVHLCHELDHAATQTGLPPGIDVSHDGLVCNLQ
ncbi:MAG: hypothetical protein A2498_07055 [Lentisphaerae bacterium RIFOXYC12_FULL_60_16]|nr:MAG: hypothetical protein A2498_07055 [Lentisphaerae bacterium RIFOXYC12_FULL_60_16]OGV85687.1 MAG: hypothetical protein A2340_16295 [Lentisphaerae bacterium RIFOXYB12_FULL_60_10]